MVIEMCCRILWGSGDKWPKLANSMSNCNPTKRFCQPISIQTENSLPWNQPETRNQRKFIHNFVTKKHYKWQESTINEIVFFLQIVWKQYNGYYVCFQKLFVFLIKEASYYFVLILFLLTSSSWHNSPSQEDEVFWMWHCWDNSAYNLNLKSS